MKKKKPFSLRNTEKSIYRNIKIPIKTILNDKNEILPLINNLVSEMNDLTIHCYQFIRLYILFCYNNKKDLPINETFILYCLKTLGSKDTRGGKPKNTKLLEALNAFYEEEYQPLLNHQKTNLRHKSHLVSYVATQIFTSISNNIQERFIQHLLRFINKTTQKITTEKPILFRFKNQLLNLDEKTEDIFDEWKDTHLKNIFPNDIKKSIHYDIKIDPFRYLKGMLYMNFVLEEQGNKLFQPLPLRTNIIPKHITLDTASLIDLFCPKKDKDGKKIIKSNLLKYIKDNQHDIWSLFFNLNHKIFKNKEYHFRYMIQTDGISCSLLFIRKDCKDKKWGSKLPNVEEQEFYNIEDLPLKELEKLKDRNIVGCDPGKRSLVYMVDKDRNKLQFTAAQRRIESMSKRNSKILLREKKKYDITKKETKLSSENSKTTDYEKFKSYLQEKNRLNSQTKDFYERDTWRKMKFRQYSYGKKSIDKFLNRIQEKFGSDILIGYGNWSRSTQMKNFMPTMNKGLRKLIHKRFDTVTINECNTSKKCCGCNKDLEYYKDKDGKKVYRLLVCSGCVSLENKGIAFRTRDVNSAVNIMSITKDWLERQERRECFKLGQRRVSLPSE